MFMKNNPSRLLSSLALAVLVMIGAMACRKADSGGDTHDHQGHSHKSAASSSHTDDGASPMCEEHRVAEAECAICQPQAIAKLKPGQALKLRLPSTSSADLIGLQTGQPSIGTVEEGIECLGEMQYNQNQLARIVAPLGGILELVEVDQGTRVQQGQTVATLWSATLAEAVAKAVLTHQTLEREQKLNAQQLSTAKDLQEAEAAHRAACQSLRLLGFTEARIDELARQPQERVLLPVQTPLEGEIVERFAVRGEQVEAGRPLFTVVNRSTMWAILHVPEASASELQSGQTVELRSEALPDRVFRGQLTWISPAVDDRTRLVRVRAEVPNTDGLLRHQMFVRARILTRQRQNALLLPAAAIQRVDGRPLVFVKLAEDLYETRLVTLGPMNGPQIEITVGLKKDDTVAITRTFALKNAMLMSRLGAGCADD